MSILKHMKMSLLNLNMVLSAKKHNVRPFIVDWVTIDVMYVSFLLSAFFARLFPIHSYSPAPTSLLGYIIAFPRRAFLSFGLYTATRLTVETPPSNIRRSTSITVSPIFDVFAFSVRSVTSDP